MVYQYISYLLYRSELHCQSGKRLPSHQAIQNGLKISEKLHLVQQHIVLILVVNASCDIFADSAFLSILYELKFAPPANETQKEVPLSN